MSAAAGQHVILAIEASQRSGGIALRMGSGEAFVEMFHETKRHDDDLLPAIDRLFTRAKVKPNSIEAVIVSIGPGGFTGLRIATATAKALAETTGCAIVAVPSALVAAEASAATGPIFIALASKRESAWWTRCERDGDGFWRIVGDAGIREAGSLDLTDIERVLADEHLPRLMRDAVEGAGIPIDPPSFAPSELLNVGERMLARGETIDPLELLPLYPREPEAVKVWRERGEARTSRVSPE